MKKAGIAEKDIDKTVINLFHSSISSQINNSGSLVVAVAVVVTAAAAAERRALYETQTVCLPYSI
jgi:hypothetical protein